MNRSPNSCGNAFRAPENHPRRSIMEPLPLPSWSRLKNNTTLPSTYPSRRPSRPRALHCQPLPRKPPLRRRAIAPPLPRRKNRGTSRPRCVRLCPAVEARLFTLPCEPAQSQPDPCQRPRVPDRFFPDRGSPCRRRRRLHRIPHRVRWLRNRPRAPLRRQPNQVLRQHQHQPLGRHRRRCPFDRHRPVRT